MSTPASPHTPLRDISLDVGRLLEAEGGQLQPVDEEQRTATSDPSESTVNEFIHKMNPPVALEPHDQILLIRKFRDAHMQGVLLEDHRSLKFYGLIDKVESNLFLARTNPLKNEIAELLLIDGHSLTPHQKKRMQEACATQDKHYYRHCMQM